MINFGTWFIFSFPIAVIMLVLTWLWLHFLFLGCKWVELRCPPRLSRSLRLRFHRVRLTDCVFSFRETCSLSKKRKTKREMMSERRIHEEYAKLGPIRCVALVSQRQVDACG